MDGRKLLAAVVLVPALVYAGAKAYVYRNVSKQFDELKAMAAPYATLQRGDIGSTLWSGRIAVADITVQPTGFTDVVRIDELSLELGGPLALLRLSGRLRGQGAPDSGRFAVRGLGFDLNGQMAESLDKLMTQAATSQRPMDHCGGIAHIGPREYRKLGYDRLVNDFSVDYGIDQRAHTVRIKIEGMTRDMGSFAGDAELAEAGPGERAGKSNTPRLIALRASYRDTAYVERLKRYCMQASGLSAEAFIDAEVVHLSDTIYDQWDTGLGPGLRAAYREFLAKPGEVRVEARPRDNLDARLLALMGPQDLVQLLDVTLTVNGNAVTDLSFDANAKPAPRPVVTEAVAAAGEDPSAAAGTRPVPARAGRSEPDDGYRVVRIADLTQHLGRDVRVQAFGAVTREGILAEVQPTAIVVERRYAGGAMTVRVPVKQIRQVEVRF